MGLLSKYELDKPLAELRKKSKETAWIAKWNLSRGFGKLDKKITKDYLEQHQVHKLHIGCGFNILDGWLNTNYFPRKKSILHLDATKPFPFEDQQFAFVFSEHMIGHLDYDGSIFMLKECKRVLRPGGRIRISIASLPFMIDLYNENKTELQQNYLEWASANSFKNRPPEVSDTYVINNLMVAWGNLFFYDEKTLRQKFELAGFTDIVSSTICESNEEHLRDLEYLDRMPKDMLKLESLVMEAVAPKE